MCVTYSPHHVPIPYSVSIPYSLPSIQVDPPHAHQMLMYPRIVPHARSRSDSMRWIHVSIVHQAMNQVYRMTTRDRVTHVIDASDSDPIERSWNRWVFDDTIR